jgi:hypothetical protein
MNFIFQIITLDNLERRSIYEKKNPMNRRQFLGTSIAVTTGLATGINALSFSDQKKKSDIKVGL